VFSPGIPCLEAWGEVNFSHGHYIESIYSLMTILNTVVFPDRKRPTVIAEVEAENFAWIDFLWSTLGRSGDVGQNMGLLYTKMQDNQQIGKLTSNVVSVLLARSGQAAQSRRGVPPGMGGALNVRQNPSA
jgi:hypothetical protein